MVIATASVFAQKASFAGKWVMVPPADAAAGGARGGGRGGGRGGFGQEFTIEQTDKTITIIRMMGDQQSKQTYTIGGDTKETMPGRGGEAGTEVVTKTAWEGNDLVMTTTLANGERKRVLSIKDGNLVITTTAPGREGGPQTTTVTYKKG